MPKRQTRAALAAGLSKIDEAVRTERQRFNDVLETLPAYPVLLTPDHHVAFANRFFRERFGESHGKRCFEYLFQRPEPCEVCETYKVLETNAPQRWEWTGPDGRLYDIYDFPFTDTDGARLILEMSIDITERKQAEAKLREWNDALEQRVAERTTALQELNATLESKVAQRTAELEYRARQLQKLTLDLSQTEDRERKRMADILHDDLQQQLAAAKFHLSLLNNRARHDPHQQAIVSHVDQLLKEAVDLAGRLEPDVVIMDVAMPLISGDQATRQIKTHWPQIRVVGLSMYNEPETVERMRRAGAEAYVLKTASPGELLAAIRGKAPDS